jgi:hypothetical protein
MDQTPARSGFRGGLPQARRLLLSWHISADGEDADATSPQLVLAKDSQNETQMDSSWVGEVDGNRQPDQSDAGPVRHLRADLNMARVLVLYYSAYGHIETMATSSRMALERAAPRSTSNASPR